MTNTAKSAENESENDSSTTSESHTKIKSRQRKRGRKSTPCPCPYKYTTFLTETPAIQIFAVAFNHFIRSRDLFATASGNRISVYECVDPEDARPVKLLRVYVEPDKDEVFNCVAWSYEMNGGNSAGPVLAAGGVKGVVRVISCNKDPSNGFKNLFGHTGAINDLKFHTLHPHLLVTGSKDLSIRLWNVKNSTCIAIFSGIRGHRDEVLTVDISADGKSLISGGIDHNLMEWNLDSEEIQEKIKACNGVESFASRHSKPFSFTRIHFPEFSTRDVHGNYVDSVKYFGSTFLSKSCENNIIWWKKKEQASKGPQVTKLFTFDIVESEIWFMRFEMNFQMTQLAVGSQNGKIFIFNLDTKNPVNRRSTASHPRCTAPVRQMAFSRNGNILVATCDDGTVWRWDRKESKESF